MSYVRAHYRRRRGFGRGRAGSDLALGIVVIVGAAIAGLVALISAAAQFVATNWVVFAAALGTIGVAFLARFVWLSHQRGLVNTLLRAADEIEGGEAIDLKWFANLRRRTGTLPPEAWQQLEEIYRSAVRRIVKDGRVSEKETHQLGQLEEAFGLDSSISRSARIAGFLEVYAAVMADGRLTEEEDRSLEQVREALDVPRERVREQLARMGEFRKLREFEANPLVPLATDVNLKKGELCYFAASVEQMKSKVARSYAVAGTRISERELATEKEGRLFVTSERLLVVAGGATSIKLEEILELGVDVTASVLSVTKDGRKNPILLRLDEPFYAAAVVRRLLCVRGGEEAA